MRTVTANYLAQQGFSPTIIDRFWDKVFVLTYDKGCWLWTGSADNKRYGAIVSAYDPTLKRAKCVKAHIVSWVLHFGPVPDGQCVCHTCDVPLCVRPDHLWIGTHAENMRDMMVKGRGRGLVGEAHNMAKLTDEAVKEIRNLYSPSLRNGDFIARQFDISRSTVNRIVKGRLWSHVEGRPFLTGSLRDIKLTQEKANAIREEYAHSETSERALAKKYNVAHGTIHAILKRRTWIG